MPVYQLAAFPVHCIADLEDSGELVLHCEHLQTVKYRNAELARKNGDDI